MPPYDKHIFVCENQRPPGHPRGCCQDSGGAALRARLKQLIKDHGLKGQVRANAAGCLDTCEYGPTIVVYPEAVWYGGLNEADVDEIFERHILGGEIVDRLRIEFPARKEKKKEMNKEGAA